MVAYVLRATVQDEICIAMRQEAGNQYETLDYIPGRLIWGALAALTGVSPGKRPDDTFMRVFYSGDVIFANLYPAAKTIERATPVPLSARTRKSKQGFLLDELGDGPGEYAGGVCDWLLHGVPPDADHDEFKRFPGFYAGDPPSCQGVMVPRTFITQHERDNRRGVTREGRLFTRQLLTHGTAFLGYLRSNSAAGDQAVMQVCSRAGITVPGSLEVSVGRSPGRITLEILPEEQAPGVLLPPLQSLEPDTPLQFTVTCLSDTLLVDDYLRSLQQVSCDLLQRRVGSVVKRCRRERFFSTTAILPGWNGAYQRPCEEEVAIAKGSAFLFTCELAHGKTAEDLLLALNALQQQGLGLRRAEGFGEICINDPFHRRFPPTLAEGETS